MSPAPKPFEATIRELAGRHPESAPLNQWATTLHENEVLKRKVATVYQAIQHLLPPSQTRVVRDAIVKHFKGVADA